MLTPPEFKNFIATMGRSLSEINQGSNEIAMSPPIALRALDLLSGSQIAILGGDILSDASGKLVYTHENWYCEKALRENPIEFVKRSQTDARKRIGKLSERNDKNTYVVLVYSELGIV
jgi:hypothetical protein